MMDARAFAEWVATGLGIAATLAVIISAIVAVIKSTLGDLLSARYYSITAVGVGLALGYLSIPLFDPTQPVGLRLFYGMLGGLTASRLFRSDKAASESATTTTTTTTTPTVAPSETTTTTTTAPPEVPPGPHG